LRIQHTLDIPMSAVTDVRATFFTVRLRGRKDRHFYYADFVPLDSFLCEGPHATAQLTAAGTLLRFTIDAKGKSEHRDQRNGMELIHLRIQRHAKHQTAVTDDSDYLSNEEEERLRTFLSSPSGAGAA